jgi:DNA excision repair protein ERCC-2
VLVPFDAKTGTVKASIKVLIGLCRPPDTLRSPEASIDIRTRQREHTRKQREIEKETPSTAEVPCLLTLERNGIGFVITGRADLLTDSGRVLEIKTAHPLPEKPETGHILQTVFYVNALSCLQGALVYTDPDTGDSAEFMLDAGESQALWSGFLDDVSAFVRQEWERHRALLALLPGFGFPFPEVRKGQDGIISSVAGACRGGAELLLQAPTGTGKTAAVLTGAIPAAVMKWHTIFFLTAKNTQKRILAETMALFIAAGFPLRTIVISSRENSCPMNMERCNPDVCPYAEVFGPAIRQSGIVEELSDMVLITTDILVEKAERAGICPFELSLYISQRCDIIACDYNYVFDPGVRLKRFFDDDDTASRCVLLIDEAANLPERVRGIWSPEIRTSWMDAAWNRARGNRRMLGLLRPWRKLLQGYAAKPWSGREDETELPAEVRLPAIDRRRWQQVMGGDAEAPGEVYNLCRSINGFARVQERLDGRFHLLACRDKDDTLLKYYCTDPSAFIAEEHARCASVCCFSATLAPLEHFSRELGLSGNHAAHSVPWPYPIENLRVWVDADIDTRYRHRNNETEGIVQRLAGARAKRPGTWMVYFPSFSWMEQIALEAETRELGFICQSRTMGTEDRERFTEAINSGDNLVMAVAGGLFAEGIDLCIPDLQGCFIAGPALPSVSLRQQLLTARYNETGRNGFLHAFAVPGINRVIQAAGRLIRNGEQKADLILLGRRFLEPPYVSLLPEHWFPLRVIRRGRVTLRKKP